MPFGKLQLLHQSKHVALIDEGREADGEGRLVAVHIVQFRSLEAIDEVLADKVLAVGEEVLLFFAADGGKGVGLHLHRPDVACPGVAHDGFELFQIELLFVVHADSIEGCQIISPREMGDIFGILRRKGVFLLHEPLDIVGMDSPDVETLGAGLDGAQHHVGSF